MYNDDLQPFNLIMPSFDDRGLISGPHRCRNVYTYKRKEFAVTQFCTGLIHLGFAWLHWKYSDTATTDSALQWANVIVLSLLCLSDLWSFHWRWYWHVCSYD